jgi:hypothetical protein
MTTVCARNALLLSMLPQSLASGGVQPFCQTEAYSCNAATMPERTAASSTWSRPSRLIQEAS